MTEWHMQDLIEKLEKAMGPDREIDNAIWVSLGQPLPDDPVDCPARYTASIEAALTLIPKGLFWSISHGRTRSGEPLGGVAIRTPLLDVVSMAEAETTELAICIAALRARHSLTAEHSA